MDKNVFQLKVIFTPLSSYPRRFLVNSLIKNEMLMLTQLIWYHWKALDLSYRMVYRNPKYFIPESLDKMCKFRGLADPSLA
jgi:hypothetical protein